MNNELVELINQIWNMEGNTIAEKILDYCETFDKDPQEVGDILEESADFKKLFYRNCVENNIIKDEKLTEQMTKTQEIHPW